MKHSPYRSSEHIRIFQQNFPAFLIVTRRDRERKEEGEGACVSVSVSVRLSVSVRVWELCACVHVHIRDFQLEKVRVCVLSRVFCMKRLPFIRLLIPSSNTHRDEDTYLGNIFVFQELLKDVTKKFPRRADDGQQRVVSDSVVLAFQRIHHLCKHTQLTYECWYARGDIAGIVGSLWSCSVHIRHNRSWKSRVCFWQLFLSSVV